MKPRFTLRGFRPPRDTVLRGLGTLERRVLDSIWTSGEASVRDVQRALGEESAYTTIMTTLDRLHRKRLLTRRKEGRGFLYAPAVTREEFESAVARDVIGGMLDRHAEPMIACIVDAVTEHDRQLLDDLERLVREKKRQLRREK